MLALILGTSEGKNILKMLNEFTDDLLISTATSYGGELLKDYKYKYLNTTPLNADGLIKLIKTNKISLLIDASHPYAAEITSNCRTAAKTLNIPYLRYERPSVCNNYKDNKNIIFVESYDELINKIITMKDLNDKNNVILNTTGSKNLKSFINSGVKNRIIHRVLPSEEAIKQCLALNIKIEDIVAIKGPISYELNIGFIKQYNAKAIILKDSGIQGGTEEKILAALNENIYAFVIARKDALYDNIFYNEKQLVDFIKNNYY